MGELLKALLFALALAGFFVIGGVMLAVLLLASLIYFGLLALTGRGVLRPAAEWGKMQAATAAPATPSKPQPVIIETPYRIIESNERQDY